MLGMGVGLALERRYVRFGTEGGIWQRVARFLLGILVALGLRFGLKVVFEGAEPEGVFRVLRYAIIGLWVTLGAPWAFVKLRLAKVE